ncbi:MAG: sigma-70 family RNA polymerase sigma factor [Micrococcales bacterium]|nr:sigma-70 family RNA polymerase sigma factor [Micrococcales bacterium]
MSERDNSGDLKPIDDLDERFPFLVDARIKRIIADTKRQQFGAVQKRVLNGWERARPTVADKYWDRDQKRLDREEFAEDPLLLNWIQRARDTVNNHDFEFDQAESYQTIDYDDATSTLDSRHPRAHSEMEFGEDAAGEFEDIDGPNEDSTTDYFDNLADLDLLSANEEAALAHRIEVGLLAAEKLDQHGQMISTTELRDLTWLVRDGRRAFDEMVRKNLRLVASIARAYSRRGIPLADAIQEGNLGLIRAVQKFDFKQGFKFSTYAVWWIRQSISRGIADTARIIRLPVHVQEQVTKLHLKNEPRLGSDLDEIDLKAMSVRTGIDISKVKFLHRAMQDTLSLDHVVVDLGLEIVDQDQPELEEILAPEMLYRELEHLLDSFPEREAGIIRMRFGVDGDPKTLEEIGELFGLTRERIRQIVVKTMKQLSHPSRSYSLRSYLYS